MVNDRVEISVIIVEPVTVAGPRRHTSTKAPPVKGNNLARGAQRIDETLKRGAHIHPAMRKKKWRCAHLRSVLCRPAAKAIRHIISDLNLLDRAGPARSIGGCCAHAIMLTLHGRLLIMRF